MTEMGATSDATGGDGGAGDGAVDGAVDLKASDGRTPGRRGRATRQRLLDATSTLLESNSYRELRVVDVARAAGTSPATFYQYFADIEAAVIALAEDMAADGEARLTKLVGGPWKGAAGFATATSIAEGYIAFWDEYWPLMRVLDLTAEEGDHRFRSLRTRVLHQFTVALSEVIASFRASGRHSAAVDPMATAGVLVSMLAHVAAHRYGFEFYGIRADDLTSSMARIVFTTVTGQKPPASAGA